MLLAFETVARTASACVVDAGGALVEERDLAGGEAEAGLVGLLDALLRAHGKPRALAVAAGPGSFTGLRVGITAARTLAWLEQLPVHAVDALAARALQEGDGTWWVLLPLKRDTTFHGLFHVADSACTTLVATVAQPDATPPTLPDAARDAVAIGPALTAKTGLAERWLPGVRLGSSAPLRATGVALAARSVAPLPWDAVLPAYHQEPAPVLQRARSHEPRTTNHEPS